HLVCNIKSGSGVSARLISGTPFLFEPYPERQITATEMIKLLGKYDTLSDLSGEIGKPNVTKKYRNSTGYDHYYELVPKDGIVLYAHICTSSEQGKFLYADICSDTKSFYNVELNAED
ncbi:MAG: hypothetical protein ACI4RG_06620, partial [Huintestinicola sp.]